MTKEESIRSFANSAAAALWPILVAHHPVSVTQAWGSREEVRDFVESTIEWMQEDPQNAGRETGCVQVSIDPDNMIGVYFAVGGLDLGVFSSFGGEE